MKLERMKVAKVVLTALMFVAFCTVNGQVADQVAQALKAGNAAQLGTYFADNVDLTIGEVEEVFAKAKAVEQLTQFFQQNSVTDFHKLHQGKSDGGLQYVIGNLSTRETDFRVSFYIKSTGDKEVVQQLMIDEE